MPALNSLDLNLDIDLGNHNFMYGFDYRVKRVGVFLDSSVPFEFSSEVAEAWGFGLGDVRVWEEEVSLYGVCL